MSRSVRSFFGPHICGDAIDFSDDGQKVLTGSYSKENQLQIWSWETGQLIDSIDWHQSPSDLNNDGILPTSLLYSAQFSKGSTGDVANKYVIG